MKLTYTLGLIETDKNFPQHFSIKVVFIAAVLVFGPYNISIGPTLIYVWAIIKNMFKPKLYNYV